MTALPIIPNIISSYFGALPPKWLPLMFWTTQHRQSVIMDFWGRQRIAIARAGRALQQFQDLRNTLLDRGVDMPPAAFAAQNALMKSWLEGRQYEDTQLAHLREAAAKAIAAGELDAQDAKPHGLAALGIEFLTLVTILIAFLSLAMFSVWQARLAVETGMIEHTRRVEGINEATARTIENFSAADPVAAGNAAINAAAAAASAPASESIAASIGGSITTSTLIIAAAIGAALLWKGIR